MSLKHFLNDFEVVQVAPVITDITFVFTFHMRYISVVRSLYFRNSRASLLITFLQVLLSAAARGFILSRGRSRLHPYI